MVINITIKQDDSKWVVNSFGFEIFRTTSKAEVLKFVTNLLQ